MRVQEVKLENNQRRYLLVGDNVKFYIELLKKRLSELENQ